MPHTIIYTLMAGFMVWIVVVVDKESGKTEGNYVNQYVTKAHCAKNLKRYSKNSKKYSESKSVRCVKVPYKRVVREY